MPKYFAFYCHTAQFEKKLVHATIGSNRNQIYHCSKSWGLNKISREIWNWCISKRIMLIARHLSGSMNKEADQLSRNVQDSLDWERNQMAFQKLKWQWIYLPNFVMCKWNYFTQWPLNRMNRCPNTLGAETRRVCLTTNLSNISCIESNQNTAYKKNYGDRTCMDNAKVTLDELRKANNAPIQKRSVERPKG